MSKDNLLSVEGEISLLYPVLVDLAFDRSPQEDGEEPQERSGEQDRSHFYGASLVLLPPHNGLHAAMCEFRAGVQAATEDQDTQFDGVSVDASYLVAFRAPTEVEKSKQMRVLEDLARSSAWPLFRALFATITAQSTFDSRALPLIPDVAWSASEEK